VWLRGEGYECWEWGIGVVLIRVRVWLGGRGGVEDGEGGGFIGRGAGRVGVEWRCEYENGEGGLMDDLSRRMVREL